MILDRLISAFDPLLPNQWMHRIGFQRHQGFYAGEIDPGSLLLFSSSLASSAFAWATARWAR